MKKMPCAVSMDLSRHAELQGKMDEAEAYLDNKALDYQAEILKGGTVYIGKSRYDSDDVMEILSHKDITGHMMRLLSDDADVVRGTVKILQRNIQACLDELCNNIAAEEMEIYKKGEEL